MLRWLATLSLVGATALACSNEEPVTIDINDPMAAVSQASQSMDSLHSYHMELTLSPEGLKLTSDGNVGISKVVFFTNFFKRTVGKKLTTSLEPIGNIRDGRTLSEIWEQGFELRMAQGSVIDRNYEYYVGWEPIESVL